MQQVISIKTVNKMNVHYISVAVFNMLTGTLVVVHILQYLKSLSVVKKKRRRFKRCLMFSVGLLSEVNLKQHAVESGVIVHVTLMHY